MTDLDKLLASRGNLQPRKALRADFTTSITEHIKAHPRPAGVFARMKETVGMKLRKPASAFAAAAIILAVGGTAYAAFNWPTITSLFGGETRLPSGNRVVAVDTQNCRYVGEPASTPSKKSHYYEVKKDAKLTNDQIVSMIQGTCEEDRANDAANTVMEPFIKDGQNILSGGIYRIEALGGGRVTLAPDSHYDPAMRYMDVLTYRLAKDIKVYEGTRPIRLDDLKAGDSAMAILHDKRPVSSVNTPADPNPYDDPQFLTVLALVRIPPLTGSPDTFHKHLGIDFVRTEPCNTNPSGFCRAYEFIP